MKKHYVFSLLVAFMILLPFVAVSPVNAGTPVRAEFVFDFTYDVENPCGYTITGQITGTIKEKFFFNDNDLKNRVADSFTAWKDTWSANGKEINIQAAGPAHYIQIPNGHLQMFLGTVSLITIPRYGVVSGSAGQLIFTWQWNDEMQMYEMTEVLKEVGLITTKDWAPICEYLEE